MRFACAIVPDRGGDVVRDDSGGLPDPSGPKTPTRFDNHIRPLQSTEALPALEPILEGLGRRKAKRWPAERARRHGSGPRGRGPASLNVGLKAG